MSVNLETLILNSFSDPKQAKIAKALLKPLLDLANKQGRDGLKNFTQACQMARVQNTKSDSGWNYAVGILGNMAGLAQSLWKCTLEPGVQVGELKEGD